MRPVRSRDLVWLAVYLLVAYAIVLRQLSNFFSGAGGWYWDELWIVWSVFCLPASLLPRILEYMFGPSDATEMLVFVVPALNAMVWLGIFVLVRRYKTRHHSAVQGERTVPFWTSHKVLSGMVVVLYLFWTLTFPDPGPFKLTLGWGVFAASMIWPADHLKSWSLVKQPASLRRFMRIAGWTALAVPGTEMILVTLGMTL